MRLGGQSHRVESLAKPDAHLKSFRGADGQGVGNQQGHVLLLHDVNAGDWNDDLQENRRRSGWSSASSGQTRSWTSITSIKACSVAVGRALPQAYLGFLEQHRGVETGVGVGDVQPTVVGHFLLQGADVRWRWTRNKRLRYNRLQCKTSEIAPLCRRLPCIKSSFLGMSGNNWWNVLLCFMKLYKEKVGKTKRESGPFCSF